MGTRTVALGDTHGDAVQIFLANTFGLSLALLKGMLVLELGSHFEGGVGDRTRGSVEDAVCACRLFVCFLKMKSSMSVEQVTVVSDLKRKRVEEEE